MRDQKREQGRYFDEPEDPEFETHRPHGSGRLYGFLMKYKFRTLINQSPQPLRGMKVLNVCCGSGMDAEFLASAGAEVTALDISSNAVKRAKNRSDIYGFRVTLVVGDAEHLPFRNQAFDFCVVHDGLHHLPLPHLGIREMCRVSSKGVLVIEPANAVVTRLAVKLGLSIDVEEAGNYVYRLSRAELHSLFESLGFTMASFKRYFMYYHHKPKSFYRIFDFLPFFFVFASIFHILNAISGRWGNKLSLCALRRSKTLS